MDRFDKVRNEPYRLYKMHAKPPRSNKTQKVFTQWIRLYPQEGPGVRSPASQRAWVRCSCEYFMFNCEYALTKNGSASIKYSNGQPARMTNPSNIPYLCKHLYKAAANVLLLEKKRQAIEKGKAEPTREEVRTPTFMKDMKEHLLRSRTSVRNLRREDGQETYNGPLIERVKTSPSKKKG